VAAGWLSVRWCRRAGRFCGALALGVQWCDE
jgi:hypothetical protein